MPPAAYARRPPPSLLLAKTQFTLGFLRCLAKHDHVVALNSPRLIPVGVQRRSERDLLQCSSALLPQGGFSTRPYSTPPGGLGVIAPYPVPSVRARVGSTEMDGVSGTDCLEPHWLLELVIQVSLLLNVLFFSTFYFILFIIILLFFFISLFIIIFYYCEEHDL